MDYGYTTTSMMSTQVMSIEIDTIVDTILNHEERLFEEFVKIDEGIGKYSIIT